MKWIGYMGVGLFIVGAICCGVVGFTLGGWWLLTLLLAFGFLWLAAEIFDTVHDDDR